MIIRIVFLFVLAIASAQAQNSFKWIVQAPYTAAGTNTYTTSIQGFVLGLGAEVKIVFTNPNSGASTLSINGGTPQTIRKNNAALSAGDILAGVPYRFTYDGVYWHLLGDGGGGGGSSNYSGASPSTITVGGLSSGSAIAGLSYDDIIEAILVPYINPTFLSFSMTGQATTVETGTTLSGSKPYVWSIALNSGTVPTIDIYDITAGATLLAGTSNDGSQSQTITTIQLNSNGATQSWRGVGNNTSPSGTFNSNAFTVTSRFYRFYGADDTPTNSAEVRALPLSAFHTGAGSFTFTTGTSATNFVVALPPGVTISNVVDTSINVNLTSVFILQGSTVNVLDAGGTNRAYNIYVYSIGSPYPSSNTIQITTAN